jgi:hypothetical protein
VGEAIEPLPGTQAGGGGEGGNDNGILDLRLQILDLMQN